MAEREQIQYNMKLVKGTQKCLLYHGYEKYVEDDENSLKCYDCNGFLPGSSLCPRYSEKDFVAVSLFPNDIVPVFFQHYEKLLL